MSSMTDLRYALRTLRRSPGLVLAAVLTLALGIGATTAIFSAVNAVLLQPLPYRDSGRLAALWTENTERGWHKSWVSPADFFDWKMQASAFQNMGAYSGVEGTALTGSGEPAHLTGGHVTGALFDVLGVHPQLGRVFREDESWSTAEPSVVLTDQLWRNRFGADSGLIGRTLTLDGTPTRVIGVLPPGFRFPVDGAQLFTTFRWDPDARGAAWFRRAHMLRVVGRLAPGWTLPQANAQLHAVAARLQQRYPELNRKMDAGVTGLHDWIVGDRRTPLLVLFGAVALLLAMAWVNVSSLLLVRAAARRREFALRSALGADRGRLVRLAAMETLILAFVGGMLGILAGYWGSRILDSARPADLADLGATHVSLPVLAFAAGVTLLSALVSGLAPALLASGAPVQEALKEGDRAGTGPRTGWSTRALMGAQVGLAFVLLVGAGLLVRTVLRLQSVDPGFRTDHRLSVTVSLPQARYADDSAVARFETTLVDAVARLPGVRSAGAVSWLPLTHESWTSDFAVQGRPPADGGVEVVHRDADGGYFRTVGVPLVAGRLFDARDNLTAPRALIINQTMAHRYFAGANPIGQRIAFDRVPDSSSVWHTVVGVVGDEHQAELSMPPRSEVFEPIAQDGRGTLRYIIQSSGADPLTFVPAVRRTVHDLDPTLPVFDIRTLDDVRQAATARQRFLLLLLGAFGVTALILATVGAFGVASQRARGRTREIGIRIALGAQRSEILRLVAGGGLAVAGVGMVLGAGAALVGSRALGSMLYGVAPGDPLTIMLAAAVLGLAVLGASWMPARRAAQVDPAQVLREE